MSRNSTKISSPVKKQADWQHIREDFPALEKYLYFYTASGGPMPRPVYEKAIAYYRGVLEKGDALWEENVARRERIRQRVADFIHAEPEEVEFVPSLSAGMNMIADLLSSLPEVVASPLEFPSTTLPWLHRRPAGVTWVKPEPGGEVPTAKLLAARSQQTGVLLTSHVQYSNGFRQDLESLGREKGDYRLVVNATQSLGAFRVDVKKMGIDALCSNSYKWLLSGYGSGILYLSKRLLREQRGALMAGWFGVENRDDFRNDQFQLLSDAARFNPGSPSFPTLFSLGAAIEYLQSLGLERIEGRVLELNRYLTERLAQAGYRVLSPHRSEDFRSGATLLELDRPAKTAAELERRCVLCTPKPEGIRIATHFFNSHSEIDQLVGHLQEIEPR